MKITHTEQLFNFTKMFSKEVCHKVKQAVFVKDKCPGNNHFFFQPLPKQQILDSSKLKEFADDKFKFDENGRKFSKQVENTGKRRYCL